MFWLVLSTFFDPVHISLGVLSALIVTYWSHDLFTLSQNSEETLKALKTTARFLPYSFWLLLQIIKANIDVVRIVLSPKLPISPQIIKFKSDLPNEVALTVLANSITLTPGTLTVDIDEEKNYYVHCLAKRHGESLLKGDMRAKVEGIFR